MLFDVRKIHDIHIICSLASGNSKYLLIIISTVSTSQDSSYDHHTGAHLEATCNVTPQTTRNVEVFGLDGNALGMKRGDVHIFE